MKIYADQVLHGYENGHQLLEASCKLNIDDRKRIDELSDLNGTTDENRYIDYYTGYPVAGGTKYVIAKTWYAHEKKKTWLCVDTLNNLQYRRFCQTDGFKCFF